MTSKQKKVSIISTHQARLRCMLSSLTNEKYNRFKNGAIIRVKVNSDTQHNPVATIDLVYSGELAANEMKKDRKYYVMDKDDKSSDNYISEVFPTKKVSLKSDMNIFSLFSMFPDTEEDNVTFVDSQDKDITLSPNNDGFVKFQRLLFENEFIFYFIRHGQANHNVMSGFTKKSQAVMGKKDTSLTSVGKEQAINSGKKLTHILINDGVLQKGTTQSGGVFGWGSIPKLSLKSKQVKKSLNQPLLQNSPQTISRTSSMDSDDSQYSVETVLQPPSPQPQPPLNKEYQLVITPNLFSSDLIRACQTVSIMMSQVEKVLINQNLDKTITIFPCIHELNYNSSGQCDGNQTLTANENKTSCTKFDITDVNSSNRCTTISLSEQDDMDSTIIQYRMDWKYYLSFYANGTRGNAPNSRNRCRNYNTLTHLIYYLTKSQYTTKGGKRKMRKMRKTRKIHKLNKKSTRSHKSTRRHKSNKKHTRKNKVNKKRNNRKSRKLRK